MDYYSPPSVCRIMGITLRQLRHWVDTDIIRPAEMEDVGNQKRYSFDFRNLLEISLVLALKQRSLSLQQIKKAVETFNEELKSAEPMAKLTLFSDGDSFFTLSRNPHDVFDVLRRGQTIFAVPVDDLALKLAQKISIPEKEIPKIISREKKDNSYVLIKFKF